MFIWLAVAKILLLFYIFFAFIYFIIVKNLYSWIFAGNGYGYFFILAC